MIPFSCEVTICKVPRCCSSYELVAVCVILAVVGFFLTFIFPNTHSSYQNQAAIMLEVYFRGSDPILRGMIATHRGAWRCLRYMWQHWLSSHGRVGWALGACPGYGMNSSSANLVIIQCLSFKDMVIPIPKCARSSQQRIPFNKLWLLEAIIWDTQVPRGTIVGVLAARVVVQ